ncbi:hypothetical protein [Candidatus Tisiphia endosymbiont of Nemotelus uliginosus]|uniref:hypothetical protein n=1 Tax=Candidatus Tisiphia endosymbiont of Nemotelus uliginosus TaxID=3077926 RepID=UPI0035C89646
MENSNNRNKLVKKQPEQIEQHKGQVELPIASSCQGSQGTLPPSKVQAEERISKMEELTENARVTAILLATSLRPVMQKIADTRVSEITVSPYSTLSAPLNNKGWFKRKRLADFHPLTEEDANLLQIRSNREFNLSFINKLLLKLADQYPNHHFCNKKVLLNYMVKALTHELRESSKVNNSNFQFKSSDPEKLKEQYLEKIERSTDISKQAQLRRKIAGVFEPNMAYELLTSCKLKGDEQEQYQLQLLKDISLSDLTTRLNIYRAII